MNNDTTARVAEYDRWIQFHAEGNGSYDDFLVFEHAGIPAYAKPSKAATLAHYSQQLAQAEREQADARDAELLDFLVDEQAVVEVIEPSKKVYLAYSDGRIQAGSFPSPREAITAAIAAAKGE